MYRKLNRTVAVVSIGLLALCAEACGNSTSTTSAVNEGSILEATRGAELANGILWQTNPVAAFEDARLSNRPVMLYFTADWCPPCHDLKAHVFPQPGFIEKSRLFVPVYLDGDEPEAQAWVEKLGVIGYPTMVVMEPNGTEIVRVSGGMNLAAYEDVLATALSAAQPIDNLLDSLDEAGDLTLASCRRLAYHAWSNDTAYADSRYDIGVKLISASQQCPAQSKVRARLKIAGTAMIAPKSAIEIEQGRDVDSLVWDALADVYEISLDPEQADPNALVVLSAPEEYFTLSGRFGEANGLDVLTPWVESLARFGNDPRNTSFTRLYAIGGRLSLMADAYGDGELSEADVIGARNAVERFLDDEDSNYGRSALLVPAVYTLTTIGDDEAAEALLLEEMQQATAPYYQMASLARLLENRGEHAQALDWFEKAYDGSSGFETRLQWGSRYARACIRLDPSDDDRIVSAAIDVVEELEHAELSARAQREIERLGAALAEWNADGQHNVALADVRSVVLDVCETFSAHSEALCEGFQRSIDGEWP